MRMILVADGELGRAIADLVGELAARTGWDVLDSPSLNELERADRYPSSDLSAVAIDNGSLADLVVRISWRDVRGEFDRFATAVAGLPWLPVAYTDPFIRIGPLVIPGSAPCYSCYTERVRQHDHADERLEDAYRADPTLGVRGYAPHLAAIAAGHALDLANSLMPSSPNPPDDSHAGVVSPAKGEVRMLDCVTENVNCARVLPVTGCPACDFCRTSFAMGVDLLRALAGGAG